MARLLQQQMPRMETKRLYSFDIFDTLLARRCEADQVARDVIGSRLGKNEEARRLLERVRPSAKRAADKRLKWATTLEDVYREAAFIIDTTEIDGHDLVQSELACEIEALYPIPENVQKLRAARAQRADIVFVSDMHIRAPRLQEILQHFGLWNEGDRIFVSCDFGLTKAEGLFDILIENGHLPAKGVVHVGNSYDSDVRPAERAGFEAVHLDRANVNAYERSLGAYSHETMGLSARLAGASRYARLHVPAESPHHGHLRDVAAGVVSPVLVPFVLWALQRADRKGVKRLYFPHPEGHILFQIARRLVEKGADVACEPRAIYVSRQALRCACSGKNGKPNCEDCDGDPEPLENGSADLVVDYLRQEGLGDAGRNGIVEHGGTGSIHVLLNRVVAATAMNDFTVWGGCFGLTSSIQDFQNAREAFFFDENRGVGWNPLRSDTELQQMMEVFCASNHGSVTGYRRSAPQRIDPEVEESSESRLEAWGLRVVHDTIHRFLDVLVVDDHLARFAKLLRPPQAEIIHAFWERPGRGEANAWGAFPREWVTGDGKTVEPHASAYHWSDIVAFARYGRKGHEKIRHQRSWLEGSLAVCSDSLKYVLQITMRLSRKGRHLKERLFKSTLF